VNKAIWQKAASSYCHPSQWWMHSSDTRQAHSSGPHKSAVQTASLSVQPFLHSSSTLHSPYNLLRPCDICKQAMWP